MRLARPRSSLPSDVGRRRRSAGGPTLPPAPAPALRSALARARRLPGGPPLLAITLAFPLLALFFAVGLLLDPRVVTGAPAWLKPLKFAVSIPVYTGTLLWMLALVPRDRAWKRVAVRALGWTTAAVFVLEMIPIALQAARGVASHFNFATPFDAALFSLMGASVTVLWVVTLLLGIWLLFERLGEPTLAWGVRLGVLVALVGMGEGFLMTSPTAQQMAGWQAGGPVSVIGAHAVGAPDDGPGLPVLGWSREGGDLRAGHFVGMHALQVLPLVGWLASRRRRASARGRVTAVAVVAAGWLALTGLLVQQALAARPLLRPDAAGVAGYALVALGVALGTALALRPARGGGAPGRAGPPAPAAPR